MIDGRVEGIDVSHHNGTIDWTAVRAGGIDFAYVKMTEGMTGSDPRGEQNVAGARAAGLPVGVYHFVRPLSSITGQIERFAAMAKKLGGAMLMPALDFEWCGKGDWDQLPMQERRAAVDMAVSVLHQLTGHAVAVYLGASWIADDLGGQYPPLRGCERLWLADAQPDDVPVPKRMPRAFNGTWTFWQYGCRPTPGVPTPNADRDRFVGSLADLAQLNRTF